MSVLPIAKIVSAALVGAAGLSAAPHAAATATRFQLNVRIIDRSGQQVNPLDLQFLNLASGTNTDLGQSTSGKVRAGRYNVAAWIGTGTGDAQTFTLADQVIDVTRNRTITMDARQGRRVQVKLNAPGAVQEVLEFAPIVDGDWAFNPSSIADSLNGGTSTAPAYVVPMKAKGMTLYTYTVWEKKGNTVTQPSPFRYDIIDVYRGGFPAHPNIHGAHVRSCAGLGRGAGYRPEPAGDADADPDGYPWPAPAAQRWHHARRHASAAYLLPVAGLSMAADRGPDEPVRRDPRQRAEHEPLRAGSLHGAVLRRRARTAGGEWPVRHGREQADAGQRRLPLAGRPAASW
jgi:hypothetical protein